MTCQRCGSPRITEVSKRPGRATGNITVSKHTRCTNDDCDAFDDLEFSMERPDGTPIRRVEINVIATEPQP